MIVFNFIVVQVYVEVFGSKKFVILFDLCLVVLFIFLILFGLIVGLIGEKVMGNDVVMWIGFGFVYFVGGILVGCEVLYSLFVEKKFDVDLLMVFVVFGVVIIGQVVDGVILLFFFSFFNIL